MLFDRKAEFTEKFIHGLGYTRMPATVIVTAQEPAGFNLRPEEFDVLFHVFIDVVRVDEREVHHGDMWGRALGEVFDESELAGVGLHHLQEVCFDCEPAFVGVVIVFQAGVDEIHVRTIIEEDRGTLSSVNADLDADVFGFNEGHYCYAGGCGHGLEEAGFCQLGNPFVGIFFFHGVGL